MQLEAADKNGQQNFVNAGFLLRQQGMNSENTEPEKSMPGELGSRQHCLSITYRLNHPDASQWVLSSGEIWQLMSCAHALNGATEMAVISCGEGSPELDVGKQCIAIPAGQKNALSLEAHPTVSVQNLLTLQHWINLKVGLEIQHEKNATLLRTACRREQILQLQGPACGHNKCNKRILHPLSKILFPAMLDAPARKELSADNLVTPEFDDPQLGSSLCPKPQSCTTLVNEPTGCNRALPQCHLLGRNNESMPGLAFQSCLWTSNMQKRLELRHVSNFQSAEKFHPKSVAPGHINTYGGSAHAQRMTPCYLWDFMLSTGTGLVFQEHVQQYKTFTPEA